MMKHWFGTIHKCVWTMQNSFAITNMLKAVKIHTVGLLLAGPTIRKPWYRIEATNPNETNEPKETKSKSHILYWLDLRLCWFSCTCRLLWTKFHYLTGLIILIINYCKYQKLVNKSWHSMIWGHNLMKFDDLGDFRARRAAPIGGNKYHIRGDLGEYLLIAYLNVVRVAVVSEFS